jgi:hypothetical protein
MSVYGIPDEVLTDNERTQVRLRPVSKIGSEEKAGCCWLSPRMSVSAAIGPAARLQRCEDS